MPEPKPSKWVGVHVFRSQERAETIPRDGAVFYTMTRATEAVARMDEVGREYAAARERGDFDVAGVIAGESCALIHDIPPAGEIVERIGAEAERLIRSQAAVLG